MFFICIFQTLLLHFVTFSNVFTVDSGGRVPVLVDEMFHATQNIHHAPQQAMCQTSDVVPPFWDDITRTQSNVVVD